MSTLHRLIRAPPPTLLLQQHIQFCNQQRHVPLATECDQLPTSSVYVMINTDEVPNKLETMVDIFYLFDSIRYIVGYCLPLKFYVENFGNAEACRVIRAIENVQLYQEHITRFKFHIAPLNVVPVNEPEFYEMIGASQNPMENQSGFSKNRFYMRPSICRPSHEVMQSVDCSATQFVGKKFKLNTNPHLIPIRLPDGLECYIRLDLAKHCQEEYCAGEAAFGFYHFREVQRDANSIPTLSRPPPPLPILPSALQQHISRPPPPLPLKKTSSSSQSRYNDFMQFDCVPGKENKFGWKYSQSLNSAM